MIKEATTIFDGNHFVLITVTSSFPELVLACKNLTYSINALLSYHQFLSSGQERPHPFSAKSTKGFLSTAFLLITSISSDFYYLCISKNETLFNLFFISIYFTNLQKALLPHQSNINEPLVFGSQVHQNMCLITELLHLPM